jgi:transcription initiation factor TFIID TATA-box-binding protein
VVCTGARTKNAARLALWKYVRMLRRIGLCVGMYHFEIQNVVASADFARALDLAALRTAWGADASYEAALFPGLVLRPRDIGVVFLLFRSGRVVITGAKGRNAARDALVWLRVALDRVV